MLFSITEGETIKYGGVYADCECLPGCPFFNEKMANMPALSSMMKKNYRQGEFMDRARHKVKEAGKDKVPANLFPNQVEKANSLIANAASV